MLLGPAGAILLAACYGAPGRYYGMREPINPQGTTRMDRDHDGVLGPYECVGGNACAQLSMPPPPDLDCDDNDPTKFPGGADVDGDGVDSNCDGVDGWADSTTVAKPYAQPPGSSPPATVATPPAGSGSAPATVATPP